MVLALLAAAGCHRDASAIATVSPSASTTATAPADHLAPNELLEGDAQAFGLLLPRGMHVDHAFLDVVYASGATPTAGVVQYVRTRVREGKMIKPGWSDPDRTTFEGVRVPAMPDKELLIYVQAERGAPGHTRVEVHDVTPQKSRPLADEAARWAAQGLRPNGQFLDPTRVQ